MISKFFLILVIVLIPFGNVLALVNKLDSLAIYANAITKSNTDEERLNANAKFYVLLQKFISTSNCNYQVLDSIKILSKLFSKNKQFKLFNWAVPLTDNTFQYYGFIQIVRNKKTETHRLLDKAHAINNVEQVQLENTKWWGCWYYDIIENKHNNKVYYTLLGWDANDATSNKRIIDVVTITANGFIKFGAPIFYYEKENKIRKRVIFEYSEQASMSLKYEPIRKQIVFDGLSPSSEKFKGNYAYYGPDLTFDAFEFVNGKWLYKPLIDILNDDRFLIPNSKIEK